MVKAMFGCNAVQVPFHGVVQHMGCGPDRVRKAQYRKLKDFSEDPVPGMGVALCLFAVAMPEPHPLMFGGKNHTVIQGDMVIRPAHAATGDHLLGSGASGIITSSSMCGFLPWIERGGRMLIRDYGRVAPGSPEEREAPRQPSGEVF